MRNIWKIRESIIGFRKRNLGGKRQLTKYRIKCEVKIKIILKKCDGIEQSGFVWHIT